MTTPSISVVIPTFGSRPSLGRAVESALEQTLPVQEVIVVDDGSPEPVSWDDLPPDPRVRLVTLRQNRGGGAARNAGISAARGEWIALLDSDDVWLPQKLSLQFAGEHDRRSEEVLATNVDCVTPSGTLLRKYNWRPPREPLSEYFLVDACSLQTSTLVLRRELALRVPFDEELRKHQDWDLLLRLQRAGATLTYDDRALVRYTVSEDQTRVSQHPDPSRTLRWFAARPELTTTRGRQHYYCYQLFATHLGLRPREAIVTFLRLARHRLGPYVAVKYLGSLVRDRARAASRRAA